MIKKIATWKQGKMRVNLTRQYQFPLQGARGL